MERIILLDLFTKTTEKTPKIPKVVESVYTKKNVETLPYLTEEEKVSSGLVYPLIDINFSIFQKTPEERRILKECKKDVVNKHPKTITSLENVFASMQ